MPYLLSKSFRYENGKYILWNIDDLSTRFPFVLNEVVMGKIVGAYIDGKVTRVGRDFRCKIARSGNFVNGEILEPNPLKEKGIPPCDLLMIFYKYETDVEIQQTSGLEAVKELPIMEGMLLKGTTPMYFEDEVKRIFKEEEIRITLESVVFHPSVSKLASILRDAFFLYEQENFSSTKTSCRKIVERLRSLVDNWESIDQSTSLNEKFRHMLNSLYSFSSVGGPHEGVVSKEETELVLKTAHAFLLYVNSLLKNDRFTAKSG